VTALAAPQVGTFRAIGTTATVAVTEPCALPEALAAVSLLLEQADVAMSRFRDDSEIFALACAGGRAIPVSPLLADAVEVALAAAADTDGIVDPTIGASMVAAGYDRDLADVVSDPAGVLLPRPAAGWRSVDLHRSPDTLAVPPGVVLDLGATGKAFLADRAAETVVAAVGGGALVSLGGDVAVAGEAPTTGWSVRISEQPDAPLGGADGVDVAVSAGGLATSSTLLRRWQRGRHQLHHIFDPTTGLPAPVVWRTVSVAAATCAGANAASTTAVVLGTVAPAWLATRHLPARLVADDGWSITVGGWPEDAP
jgi:thiamine biosynthesis lipoprotein ApbE